MPSRSLVLAALLTTIAAPVLAQADVIRGRVTGPDSLPIENVVVTATTLSGNVSRTARTDKQGRYTITFPGGEGDYMVSFASLGFAARRFQVKRIADEDILIADARLQRVNQVLDAVDVVGERQRPNRNQNNQPDASGTERIIANNEVPANLLGDLAAMAASLPGVTSATNEDGSNGYSVLGLGADQNNATLNGMSFGGANLPRDASVSTSLVTSPYDVSRGGFSGAQMNIRTRPGSNFIARTGSLNFDSPALQWTDRAVRSLGQEYTSASLGGLVSGPLVFDKAFYNLSYQLGRRANDFQTLTTADASGLKAAGVSPGARDTLQTFASAFGIPRWVGTPREDRIGDNGLIFGAVDLTSPSATSGRALNVAFNGGWGKQTPASGTATELPSYGGDRTNWRVGVQGRHSNFFGVGILTETSIGLNASKNYGDPYLDLPAGRVRATSTFGDGTSAVQFLSFGGNQSMNTEISSLGFGAQSQLSWFTRNNKHRLRLTTELRHENADQLLAINTLGTFSYNSLADLQANTPSSFSRSLSPRSRDISQLTGAISLGDSYRRTDRLQFTYGLRVDGTQYLDTPTLNPELVTLYGVKNDNLPSRIYLSPRVGFSWSYGTATQIASFFGAQRGPRAVVRGGIGVFQNLPGTNLVGQALDNTGLPSAVQQITCVGSATPVPNWSAYSTNPGLIPNACAGAAPPVFASAAPNVSAFARDYVSPRSIRSNLNWSGPTLNNRFSTSVDLTHSLNLGQSSAVDLNFSPTMQFTLADEGARPVFVPATGIVPGTGTVAAQNARKDPRYARVNEMRSDLRSESYQATLRLSPTRFSTAFSWSAWYSFTHVREQFRGFQSTVANPLGVEWGASATTPHSIGYSLNWNAFDFVRIGWFGQFRSGMRYTPMIASDVNGDGNANDRAFIFAPTVVDTAISNGITALLANGSSGAQQCLRSQVGRLAERNSCVGPWSSTATMSFTFNPLKVRMPQRASLSFQLSNPLGAADLIVNGSGNLKGWGQMPMPDPQLLYVRGFEPATGTTPARYRYEVNRRFGATNPAFNPFRAPVTLTALLRFDVGPTRERQMLTQQLDRGRRTQGTRAPEQLLRAVFGNGGGIANPMAVILAQQDTLKLTSKQADSIATLNRQYVIKLDGIWSPIVREFAMLPDTFEHDAAYHRYIVARRQTVDLLRQMAPRVRGLLTEEQFRRLPAFIASYLDTRYLASIRSGTAGIGTGGGPFGGFMPAGAEVMMVGGGGGGGAQIQVRIP